LMPSLGCAGLMLVTPLYAADGGDGIEKGSVAASVTTKLSKVQVSNTTKNKHVITQILPEQAGAVDFKVLEQRLKNTDAIGFFTKLAIRNDIIDLMDKIKKYRENSKLKTKMKEIRVSFDGLLLKIIALLEGDPDLSRDLYVGRESIWESLLEVKA